MGGAERMLVDIANATHNDGHKVSVCVTRSETAMRQFLRSDVHVEVLGRRRKVSLGAAAKLRSWILRNGVDLLHVHMRSSLAFVLAMRVAGMLRTPIVFHDHYGLIEADKHVPRWFRIGARWIDHYVGVYEALSAWALGAGVTADRVTTIPNAIDLIRVREAAPGDIRREFAIGNKRLGVLVASFKREKGIDLVIDAVAASRHRASLRILVVGGFTNAEYVAECRARLRGAGLEQVVQFIGARADVPAIVAASDFALLSSRSESGPLVLIEYLAAGKPVISTRVGDIGRRLAQAGVPGFVPANDPRAFTHALDELLELDAAAFAERARKGQQLVASGWDIRDAMPAWYSVYHQAIARGA